jgi:sulfate transport system permease protein
MPKLALRTVALGYLGLLLVLPLGMVGWRTVEHGPGPVWDALSRPAFLHALWLTILITLIAVPLNTIFGVLCALAIVRRGSTRGNVLLSAVIGLPLALSPVVVGLALLLVYGRNGWLGGPLADAGVRVIFALPGMVLATIFVSLPFVVREVVPVLRELGEEQEEAAWRRGASPVATVRRLTRPPVRGGGAEGVVLTTARSLGEFGAVSIVSGRIAGRTETLTLHVQERFEAFDQVAAYTASVVLALLAVLTLLAMSLFGREEPGGDRRPRDHQAVR